MKEKITYQRLFWLFFFGSITGVPVEGIFCLFYYGEWQTHTVAVFGPFCIIYGLGAAVLYAGSVLLEKRNIIVKFFFFSILATLVELICGMVIKYGLGMRAWDYDDEFLNYDGMICPLYSLAWGVIGVLFSMFAASLLEKLFTLLSSKIWTIACIVLTVLLAVDFALTAFCLIRWSQRHEGIAPSNSAESFIDRNWDDEFMSERFCEWEFLDAVHK